MAKDPGAFEEAGRKFADRMYRRAGGNAGGGRFTFFRKEDLAAIIAASIRVGHEAASEPEPDFDPDKILRLAREILEEK